MKKSILFFLLMLILTSRIVGQSNESTTSKKEHCTFGTDSNGTTQTIGVAIDLLPPILSATTGNFGYSGQLWYGHKKFRVRGVVVGFQMPDKLMGNDDFKDLKTTATAVIFDKFFKDNFKGWWIGTGVEMWNNTITSKVDNNNYKFTDYVSTLGGGYIFKVHKNLYIEPWLGVHYVLNNEKIVVGATEYETKRFQGEVSLKIGWHL